MFTKLLTVACASLLCVTVAEAKQPIQARKANPLTAFPSTTLHKSTGGDHAIDGVVRTCEIPRTLLKMSIMAHETENTATISQPTSLNAALGVVWQHAVAFAFASLRWIPIILLISWVCYAVRTVFFP